jgi:hypothetical protein
VLPVWKNLSLSQFTENPEAEKKIHIGIVQQIDMVCRHVLGYVSKLGIRLGINSRRCGSLCRPAKFPEWMMSPMKPSKAIRAGVEWEKFTPGL